MTASRWLVALAVMGGLSGGMASAQTNRGGEAWMARLMADSRAKSTLGDSDAYYEERHLGPTDLPRFLRYISKHPDYTSYHLLLVVRRDQREAYRKIPAEVRASVLCSTIKEHHHLSDWTEPCVELGFAYPADSNEPDQALIEIGKPALRYLLPLLDDYSAARFGDEEEEPGYDDYRRADVALRLASGILGLPYEFQAEPAERDRAIATFKREVMAPPPR
jgi:hypothetical protein